MRAAVDSGQTSCRRLASREAAKGDGGEPAASVPHTRALPYPARLLQLRFEGFAGVGSRVLLPLIP